MATGKIIGQHCIGPKVSAWSSRWRLGSWLGSVLHFGNLLRGTLGD